MDFNVKEAAQQLLKIADAIEKEAYEKTMFVCAECKHSSTLASINETRQKVASEKGIGSVNPITVNDSVYCPSCSGEMSYEASEDSEKYYVDVESAKDDSDSGDMFDLDLGGDDEKKDEEAPDKENQEDLPTDEDKKEDTEDTEDVEEVFDPVDEQEDRKKEEEGDVEMDLGDSSEVPSEDIDEPKMPEKEDKSVVEEVVEETPKKKKKKDNPADGEVAFPKKQKPKFEKMPQDKEASERFLASVEKYSL